MERKKRGRILTYCAVAIAVALIAAGVLNGGMTDVLEKAKRICMECIGLE